MSYGYDDNGNLTSRGSDSFSWDAADRLTSATVNSATTTFAYNGDGLRSARNSTTFTWDINQSIPRVIDDGTFKYVYGWPARKYGRGKRRPVTAVTYRDRYGRAW